MGQKSGPVKEPAEQVIKEIRRATRRQFSAEEKIRIVLSGLRGEDSISVINRAIMPFDRSIHGSVHELRPDPTTRLPDPAAAVTMCRVSA